MVNLNKFFLIIIVLMTGSTAFSDDDITNQDLILKNKFESANDPITMDDINLYGKQCAQLENDGEFSTDSLAVKTYTIKTPEIADAPSYGPLFPGKSGKKSNIISSIKIIKHQQSRLFYTEENTLLDGHQLTQNYVQKESVSYNYGTLIIRKKDNLLVFQQNINWVRPDQKIPDVVLYGYCWK